METPIQTFDYEKLRTLLELELGHTISLEYAQGAAQYLINIYETLMYGETNELSDGTLHADTTDNR